MLSQMEVNQMEVQMEVLVKWNFKWKLIKWKLIKWKLIKF